MKKCKQINKNWKISLSSSLQNSLHPSDHIHILTYIYMYTYIHTHGQFYQSLEEKHNYRQAINLGS